MSRLKIGFIGSSAGYSSAKKAFSEKYSIDFFDVNSPDINKLLSSCDGIVDASMRVQFTKEIIKMCPKLQIISTATTGSTHIDFKAASESDITIKTLKEDVDLLKNITPAAEMTWALILALSRNIVGAVAHTREGLWIREDFPGMMLKDKVLGIVGCGRIGSWVARYGKAFGMKIIGFDPHASEVLGIEKVDKRELARRSDIVSIHVHLDSSTKFLIDTIFLGEMKNNAIIVNTSRGAVVDETAILNSLKNKKLSGYASDVLTDEPNIEKSSIIEYSRNHDNVIVTPHCGGNSPDAVAMVCLHAANKIVKFFDNNDEL